MDKHIRMLGSLNVMFGVAAILFISGWLIASDGLRGIYVSFNDSNVGLVAVVLCVFHLLVALPCILGGMFVRRYHDWARIVLIITSALNVLNFPLGSLLGSYGLWALTTAESEPLFIDPPYPYGKKAQSKASSAHQDQKSKTTRVVPSHPNT